jgi:hypothetical protein
MSSGDCKVYSLTNIDLDCSDKASRNICDILYLKRFWTQNELHEKFIFRSIKFRLI